MSDLSEESHIEKVGNNGVSRRAVLGGIATAMTGLSGCQSNDNNTGNRNPGETGNTPTEPQTSPTPEENNSTENDGTENTTPDETTRTEDGFDGEIHSFTFSTTPDRINVPGVWTSTDSFEDYHVHTSIEVEASEDLGDIVLENNNEEVISWENVGNSFSDGRQIPLEKLSEEENQLEIELNEDWNEVLDRDQRQETVVKQVPEVYKIDFRHGKNTELRNQIKESLENPEQYLPHVEEQVTGTITSSYQSPEKLKHDKETIDLAALDFHHRNNYLQMGTWVHDIVESLDNPDKYSDAKSRERPNDYPDPHNSFSFEAFQEAESLAEGHKMLMPWISNYEAHIRNNRLHSTRDKNYAAIIQEAFDQYNDNVDVHTWAFKVGFGVHGNGLMYDEKHDSLHVMETVIDSDANQGLHPFPIEESNWLNTDTYWHPIQFKDQNYGNPLPGETETRQFEKAKSETYLMLNGIATSYSAFNKDADEFKGKRPKRLATTTGLVKRGSGALGEYNLSETDWEFNNIRNTWKTVEKKRRDNGKYVIAENTGEEIGADIYDITDYSTEEENADQLLDEVWKDEEGIYDNFEDILMEYEAGDYSSVTETAETLA